ncbi:MAG: hypothetical protein H6Q50_866 [Deltaproteobacteria bacterium]|nr:hypothetical protein [Deltaproteobacteria bacterium]
MRLLALAALGIALFFSTPGTGGAQEGCFSVLAADDLDCQPGACPGTLDAGGGVKFVLSPGLPGKKLLGPPASWMKISLLDGDLTVRELPDSYYLGYARLDHNGAGYWMIGEYTGGMHCCARYHFFARPSPGSPLRYIGTTAGSAQAIDEQPFSCRSGSLYLEDQDTRFLSFHTSYAESALYIPTHYRLTAAGLLTDNLPFKDKYLDEIQTVEAQIAAAAAGQKKPPEGLIGSEGLFSDELGQLLVKRTILYIYAREEKTAWQSLERDTAKHYRADGILPKIRQEIREILREGPY